MKIHRYPSFVSSVLLAFAVFSLLSANARAVTDQDIATLDVKESATRVVASDEPPSLLKLTGRLTLALGAVFALMAGVLWAARRYLPQSVKTLRGGGPIEILASRAIGPRKNLLLVRARDRTLLLGVTAQNIQFLAEIEPEAASWQETAIKNGLGLDTPRGLGAGAGGTTSMENFA